VHVYLGVVSIRIQISVRLCMYQDPPTGHVPSLLSAMMNAIDRN
jgi:hypothetical protein